MSTTTPDSRRPIYEVLTVINTTDNRGNVKNSRWQRLGAAWLSKDGEGFNIELEALPLGGRLMLRKPKPKSDEAPPMPEGDDVPFSA